MAKPHEAFVCTKITFKKRKGRNEESNQVTIDMKRYGD
jgi:hypothetical protein